MNLKNCRYCKEKVDLLKMEYGFIYQCSLCKARVGCHKNTTKPLGTLANSELRKLRIQAHKDLDSLYVLKIMKRYEVYSWLSRQLNKRAKDTHIGLFDIEDCHRTIEVSKKKRLDFLQLKRKRKKRIFKKRG